MLAVLLHTMEFAISVFGLSFEEEERFSELGELAELFESLNVDMDGDAIMQLLVCDLFSGSFDPTEPDAVPSRYAQSEFHKKQTLAVPTMSTSDRILWMSGAGRSGSRRIYGSSRDIIPILHQIKALPIDAPAKLTKRFIDEACVRLANLCIDQYSENARDILDSILVERTLLKQWFEEKGMLSPIAKKVGYNPETQPDAANCNELVQLDLTIVDEEPARPGRPESDLWPRVQELVTELHGANPECYNNAMASEVHERLIAEFPEQNVLALTTIQGKMMVLRDQARADLDDTQDIV